MRCESFPIETGSHLSHNKTLLLANYDPVSHKDLAGMIRIARKDQNQKLKLG